MTLKHELPTRSEHASQHAPYHVEGGIGGPHLRSRGSAVVYMLPEAVTTGGQARYSVGAEADLHAVGGVGGGFAHGPKE